MDFFSFDPATVFSFLLTFIRLSTVLFLLPFFGGENIPITVKACLCLVLTFALWPALSFPGQAFPADLWAIALMILGEVAIGLVLSLVVQFIFAAVESGGEIISLMMGYSMINVLDPTSGHQRSITAYFLYMVTLLTFLSINGHLALLVGVGRTFELIPPGGLVLSGAMATSVLTMSSQIFVQAIKIAVPVMTSVMLVDMALALISKAAPQINVMFIGFPLKIGVGFIFLGLMFTILSRQIGDFVARLDQIFGIVARSMG